MAERWKIFEKNACRFLNENINIQKVVFKELGKSNSWDSDVHVKYKDKEVFLIESKLSPSQSGQFVILLKNGKYHYSKLNHNKISKYSKEIITHINKNIKKYIDCGTRGEPIKLSKKVLAKWIKNHYSKKKVKFIITSESSGDFDRNFIALIPLKNFDKNFEVSAVLRCKKSGTRRMPKRDYSKVLKELKKKFNKNFTLSHGGNVTLKGKHRKRIYLGDNYYLANKEGVNYSVRKRSSTNNPSVIFSLKYNGKKETKGFEILKKEINKLILQFS